MSDTITYKSHSIEAVERNKLFQTNEEEERWGCESTCPPTGQDVVVFESDADADKGRPYSRSCQ